MLAPQGRWCDGAVALTLVDLEGDLSVHVSNQLPGDAGCRWSRDRGVRARVTEGGAPYQGSWEVMARSSSGKGSCRRRLDLRLQRVRGAQDSEWAEEGEGEREARAKDIPQPSAAPFHPST